MTKIKLYKSPLKGLKIFAMSIPFVLIGIWMILDCPYRSTEYIIGWATTCFFGLGLAIGLFQTFDRRPQIVITGNGIWDRTTNQGMVPWEQIVEASHFDISKQKFISLTITDTFVFKKKPYKWAANINKQWGAQSLNLHLGQIDINEIELANFINQLSIENIDERRKRIKAFQVKKTGGSASDFKKILSFFLILILLLFLSLSSFYAFMAMMIAMGVSALAAELLPDHLPFRKYAIIATWLGFTNMALCLGTIKAYEAITENVGRKLTIEIEAYKIQTSTLPTDIQLIADKLELNFLERYFADKIEYKVMENNYELEADMLLGKRRTFDKNNNDWE
jgi:hypothetical protein